MAKHRQTATGRKTAASGGSSAGGRKALEARATTAWRGPSPVREIGLVRRAGAPIVYSAGASAASSALPSRSSSLHKRKPFRFFDLPSELRLRIYEFLLRTPSAVDLDSQNYRNLAPRLNLFLVCRRMYEEAYRIFYSQPIRLFPHRDAGRFYNTKKPLLQRLSVRYREAITCVEMRLGSGWSKPPACQNTWNEALGLADCKSLRTLKIFVECDPSDNIFAGFRGKNATEETYKTFCIDLLLGMLHTVTTLETVELDAYPPVSKDSPLVVALVRQIQESQKRLVWGPLRGWDKGPVDLVDFADLVGGMRSMNISTSPTMVLEVEA